MTNNSCLFKPTIVGLSFHLLYFNNTSVGQGLHAWDVCYLTSFRFIECKCFVFPKEERYVQSTLYLLLKK